MTCQRCRQDNPSPARFCMWCGAPLASASLASTGPPLPAPGTYTPRHLAERILTSKSALEGERKHITVLFADLRGSLELIAEEDPEEARRVLDAVLGHMMQAVHHFEGLVNEGRGDGIMALFGAPLPHEDHALRACQAALHMQEAVTRYAAERDRAGLAPVAIRVGLNSGEVVVRSIGSDLRMEYSAVGRTTHLAARMEHLAEPGTILLTAATLRLVEGLVDVRPLGPTTIKGLAGPVDVYELKGLAPARTRFQAALTSGLGPFVGRSSELDVLQRALERARAGHGQVVAGVGEPGVGKSRLLHEFLQAAPTGDWRVLQTGAVSHGRGTAYGPVVDLLRAYFGVHDADTVTSIKKKVATRLQTLDVLDGDSRAGASPFLSLLDVPVDDPAWQRLDPSVRRRRVLDAVTQLALREGQRQPLLLVFEDLHWADSETHAVLDTLVESLPGARLLLLVTYRPEYEDSWRGRTTYTRLRLDPLTFEGAGELLHALLGGDASLTPLEPLLVERTGGNPFFLEESVRTLVEARVLLGEPGAYRLAQTPENIHIPPTVQAVLAARIDRLAPDTKRLLEIAAVIGSDVPSPLLAAVADEDVEALRRGLGELQGAEFLYEKRAVPDIAYTFKHALTHEVAYASLLTDRRRVLHARVVEAIERLYAERLPEHVERLAHHAERAELWGKAVAYSRQAGSKAFDGAAFREAAGHLERALAALGHLPDTPETLHEAVDVHRALGPALRWLGQLEQGLACAREAERLAERLGDEVRLGRVAAEIGTCLVILGETDDAARYSDRAHAIAEGTGDAALHVHSLWTRGFHENVTGNFRRAAATLREGLTRLERQDLRSSPPGLVIAYFFHLVWSLAELGEFLEATTRATEALRMSEALNNPRFRQMALMGAGVVHVRQGDASVAIPLLQEGAQISETYLLTSLGFFVIVAFLGRAYTVSGRADDAIPLLQRAADQAASVKVVYDHLLVAIALAEAYLLARRPEEAGDVARRSLELARKHKYRGHTVWALRLLGEIAARRDPPAIADAGARYHEAIELGTDLGMRPAVARCHLGLGTLYRRVGKDDAAREHVATALAMFRSMDMRHWPDQAEAELRALG